jgi:hypothetical protein
VRRRFTALAVAATLGASLVSTAGGQAQARPGAAAGADDAARRPITSGHFDPSFFRSPGLHRGLALECATGGERPVRVSLFQSNRDLDVVLVEAADGIAYDARSRRGFVRGHHLRARLRVEGTPATVRGRLDPAAPPVRVLDVDRVDGRTVVVRGWELPLRTRLAYAHDGSVEPLHCDTALAFRLRVSIRSTAS